MKTTDLLRLVKGGKITTREAMDRLDEAVIRQIDQSIKDAERREALQRIWDVLTEMPFYFLSIVVYIPVAVILAIRGKRIDEDS